MLLIPVVWRAGGVGPGVGPGHISQVEQLDEAPVSQGQFLEGAFKLTGSIIGDARAGLVTKNRPLQKIVVRDCGELR